MNLAQEKKYGEFYDKLGDKQFLKAVEEMNELSTEIIQYFTKGTIDKQKAAEEIGDVFNALESVIYGLNLDEKQIHSYRLQKLLKVTL